MQPCGFLAELNHVPARLAPSLSVHASLNDEFSEAFSEYLFSVLEVETEIRRSDDSR